MLIYGKDIPLHTFVGWHNLGKIPRKGQHGIPTKLWKCTKGSKNDEDPKKEKFILVKSYLFSADQVEDIKA
ncbi:MAG: hypothetical protein IJS12_09205 [Lachnospiraceae bacterium]|nr:hypothetical protein [Lachnospiraceae bacterium]